MKDSVCDKCGKGFITQEALDMHTKAKHAENSEAKRGLTDKQKKKIKNWTIFLSILIIFGGITYLIVNIKTLPPTDSQGHIEVSPPSHILKEPMGRLVHKHMLEHADGSGPPGIIINYNCVDFECENDLISKLEGFAEKYTENVYVAPFPDMDGKIVLTRFAKLEILDEFDEEKIDIFINV